MVNDKEKDVIIGILREFLGALGASPSEVRLESETPQGSGEVVRVNITTPEPQMLIGQNGQTLFEVERLVRIIINRKVGRSLYVDVDINAYKQKKIEHLKGLARESAEEVLKNKERRALSPMSPYERRIVHMELAQWPNITTESLGEGENRHIVVAPRAENGFLK